MKQIKNLAALFKRSLPNCYHKLKLSEFNYIFPDSPAETFNRHVYGIRILIIICGFTALFAGVLGNLYGIQIDRHKQLLREAKDRYTYTEIHEGERGEIFDRNGELLAGSIRCRDILAEMRRFEISREEMVGKITEIIDVDADKLLKRFNSHYVEVVVKRSVPVEKAVLLEEKGYKGLRLVRSRKRFYPQSDLAANLLGVTNAKLNGISGIEKRYNQLMLPKSGRIVVERSIRGKVVERKLSNNHVGETLNGADVFLTIDETIQSIVETELDKLVEKYKPKAAYALMADPKTGRILAMAQRPSFNPNDRSSLKQDDLQNRLVIAGFEPGSIMKPIAIAGALDDRIVSPDDTFFCEKGYWYYNGAGLRDSGHSYGNMTVVEILQKSSNIGTAKIALKMGKRKLYQTLKTFGFGQRTNIGFSVEATGILRPLGKWDGLSVTRFPIGQGILTTPLQLVQAYCALANNGWMMQLRIVDRIEHADSTVESFDPIPIEHCVCVRAAKNITNALKLVTKDGGTAESAAVPGYEVAGKTGTAQKFIDGAYSHEKYIASFIGYLPADDPAFVLLISADEPTKGSHYGGRVAGPAFSNIAEQTLRHLQIAPVN